MEAWTLPRRVDCFRYKEKFTEFFKMYLVETQITNKIFSKIRYIAVDFDDGKERYRAYLDDL
jgi:hypothetical protein